MREYGFTAAELDRAKRWLIAFYERAYNERDKTESSSFAQEYLGYFLSTSRAPASPTSIGSCSRCCRPSRSPDVDSLAKRCWRRRQPRRARRLAAETGVQVPTDAELLAALAPGERVGSRRGPTRRATARADGAVPDAGARRLAARDAALGVTVVRSRTASRRGSKPTDFKNDQVLFTMDAPGGASLAPPADFPEASLSATLRRASGAGGLKALDLQRVLAASSHRHRRSSPLDARVLRQRGASRSRDGAADSVSIDFTAPRRRPGRIRADEAPADAPVGQPRSSRRTASSASASRK